MTILFLCIYAFLFALIALTIKATIGSFRNPLSFFSLLWCVVGFVANLGYKDYYLPSDFVNWVIIAGILIYYIAFYVVFKRASFGFFHNLIVVQNERLNYLFIYTISIICIVFELPTFIRAINLVSTVGMSYMRSHASVVYSSMLINQISESFIKPVFTATTILAVITLFYRKQYRTRGLFIIAILENIILSVITAGRSPFVNALFYLMITFLLIRGGGLLKLVVKGKRIIFVILGAAAMVIYLSSLRSNSEFGFDQVTSTAFIYYFSGPSYLSRLLETYREYGIGGKLMWGQATLGFITNWFVVLLDPLFGGELETSLNIVGSRITSRRLAVGTYNSVNAMCTVYYPFLIDWGYIGIILGPIVLVFISKILVDRTKKSPSIKNVGMYVFWLYTLIRTVFKWDLMGLDFFVIMLSLHLFTSPLYKIRRKVVV